ncbi:FkbM family methyltransferase [uncultured Roseobacter sp.]|uniref:FkbM family methyltransferase n=1 Tax=uncultured Roseobacter sp. TaxID=114847 RepID=UPI0026044486|nr:FkbM family methyltransferase [uncultured Roseobacter sp.]
MTDRPPNIIAEYHGIEVPEAPHFGSGMIRSMKEGSYEGKEVRAGLSTLRPGARILEMGAGSGIVGAVLAKNCHPEKMLAIEANPNLIPHITQLYAHNGLSGLIEVRHAVVLSDPTAPARVDFFLRGNFLGSALTVLKKPEKAERVSVPVLRYGDLKQAFPHSVIVMDIEGAEREFLRHADLEGVETLIFEVHRKIYGRAGMQEIRDVLARRGFRMDDEASVPGVHVYHCADPR